MTKKESKVLFFAKNFHYAIHKPGLSGEIGFETPVHVPGVVKLALNPVGEMVKFYADGRVFYQSSGNGGYEGNIEFARIIEKMKEEIWGMKKVATDNVLIENANDEESQFAVLFELEGDGQPDYVCLYNCTASRPGIDVETSKENKEPKPQKLDFAAVPMEDGTVMASTLTDTEESVRTNWFKSVYVPKSVPASVQAVQTEAPAEKAPKAK